MPIRELAARVRATPPSCGPVRIIAVDGGAGAGKSTLAAQLAAAVPGSAVLHLDDLLEDWGGQFTYQARLHEQILLPLSHGRAARYRQYDWVNRRFAPAVELPVPETLIVEGVSAIWGVGTWLGLGVFLSLDRAARLARWIERDGPVQPEWLAWLDAEDRFFAEHPPPPGTVVL